jgi:type IV pilus assembly protein PilE
MILINKCNLSRVHIKGMTLIEIMIVIAIIGLLVCLSREGV